MSPSKDLYILIVEDESIVALDINNRLKSLGYSIAGMVSSGEAAVEKAFETRPDLVLMDIMLEGDMDGIEAADTIKQKLGVPVIYLTAYADEQTLERAKVTDPFGYIIKPFEDRELSINIEMALYKHRIERRMRENEQWLATTLRSIGDAVLTTDPRGKVRYLNPMAAKLLCISEAEALEQDLDDILSLVDEQSGEQVAGLLERVLVDREPAVQTSGLLLSGCEGKGVPIHLNIAPMRDNGDMRGAVLVLRDVTDRRKAERALRHSVVQLKTTLQETVNALAVTSEKRDPYTAGHQQRVAQLACAIGEKLGLDREDLEGLRVAALLHDIGKIYVPAEILSKPTMLTSMEMGIMKTHSEVGYDILKRVPFPWPVGDIVLQHHERLDGSGYPGGRKGDDILEEAQIIAVADVVEAMSSHRPYRAALGTDLALEEIASKRGRLYASEKVDACLDLFKKGFTFKQ